TAAVLAGGRSLRMGVDKTLLSFDGRTLVSRVTDAVATVCEKTIIVTNRPEALEDAGLPEGVRVVRDEVAYQGPLGGLTTALAEAETEWILAVAADMPHLEPEIARALWSVRDSGDVVVPLTEKGYEPLLALYRVEACLPVAREVLESGRRRLVAIYSKLKVVEVPAEALRTADPELRSLVNINTPSDLADAREDVQSPEPRERRLEVVEVHERRRRGMPQELPITVHLNDVEVATMQATPHDLEELAAGFLYAEGILTDRSALISIDADAKRGLVWVTSSEKVPADFSERARYLTSGCGKGMTFASVGHARGLAPVTSALVIDAEALYGFVRELADAATMYRDTGGMHAAGLAVDGKLVAAREDVGRHNAVDKVLGRAWLDGVDTSGGVLVATGRISYEMAVKAAKARVPVVASRSAVTDLAAELGDSLGITLAGYVRGGKLTVYTHPERIRTNRESQ
ncbi:MAG TPA: formate dehydrogenase accessory sulfurtransferase FdhD, partial [Coriobacteriia bacterium]|nr:formate dehydrogenase accessory sulfurtransferase FdhD [Coriobacteriia bacterium]